MKKLWLLMPILCCLVMAGCVQTKILEDILLIQSIGYDSAGEHLMKGTFGYSKYSGSKAGNPQPFYYQAYARTTKHIKEEVNSESAKPLELGQLRLVVFGKKRAKQGVEHIVDTLIRDPEVGTNVYLTVADGKAEDLLTRTYSDTTYPVPSMYITNMFDQNIRTQNLPTTNLHVFAYYLYDKSSDALLPLIGIKEGHPALKGLAFFHGGRYVAKIGTAGLFVFERLYENAPSGIFQLTVSHKGEKALTAVRTIKTSRSYTVKNAEKIPDVTIHVKMKAMIVDKTDKLDFSREETIDLVEQTMIKKFEKQAEEMIRRFQKKGIDPLGIGSEVKSRDRNWDYKEWRKIYPKIKVHVQAKVDIRETGAIE
ncbi:MAG TPA: Ger(x)C family spore germination protein [Bacillales bacterium]|nr:Ger(x)C family spore germination protein [Bacillales bacterium]